MLEKQGETNREHKSTDAEVELLEANKRRLLEQQDWVGTAPSRPLDLQYSQHSLAGEKTWFGNHEKFVAKSRAASRRSPVTFSHRETSRGELEGRHDTFMSGALPVLTATNGIRVRIGSDALTTAASTQHVDRASSRTDSDSMLFDEEVGSEAQQKEPKALHGEPSFGHERVADPGSIGMRPVELNESCSLQQDLSGFHTLTKRPEDYANERKRRHGTGGSTTPNQSVQQSEDASPSYRLTHHVGGLERPLKLTFVGRSTGQIKPTAWSNDKPGETQRVRANIHAEEVELGHVCRNIGDAHQTTVRRHPDPPLVDNDEPWRPYLDTSISSPDRFFKHDRTRTSVPQPHVPARNRMTESKNQPQHNVQGDLTHVNLLTVAASVHAPKRPNARLLEARPLPRGDALKAFGTDEAFWRNCALGSDPKSAVETVHTHDDISEDSTAQATKGYASTRLHLSDAVTSVSSTPFPSTPLASLAGQASRISDGVQQAARSGSRAIISEARSHAVWGGVASPDVLPVSVEQGDEIPAGSHFGEQSTQASLQNHASYESDMFSSTRTSIEDHDRRSHPRDDVSRHARASGDAVWQRDGYSSTWNWEDSDGAGIDLVDADRLT